METSTELQHVGGDREFYKKTQHTINPSHLHSPHTPTPITNHPLPKQDIFIITTSTLVSLLPTSLFRRRQGYSHLSISANGNGNSNSHNSSGGSGGMFRGRDGREGRGRGAEDENRLIDQLDEEWDD
ncbi:MAG: Cation-independent mannose-6-phosphate receptor CI-MPR [Pleopsidium flavum]|nr:MAG: Cation-independent mannose-6-phosphate receptor CI-MPR [Pleopsidium flavum]